MRKTEAHVASLMNKRDTLTNIWNNTNSFLLETHDVDIAREYATYVSAVKSVQDIKTGNLKMREMRLLAKGKLWSSSVFIHSKHTPIEAHADYIFG